ncbi:5'-deoxyadenosine deaminase [uncultured archaeon]|nr:5'-deoxyadenosine deaminase [uncultured archaeon]
MADLIIKGGRVFAPDSIVIDDGVVVVDSSLITFVGKNTGEKADKTIDARGCAVIPGLINAHTHLPMTLFRGWAGGLPYKEWVKKIREAEMKLTPADIRAGANLGVLEMIKSGTTTFADMYIHMDEVASVVEETGMRAALGYGMIEGINEDSDSKLKSREEFNRKWNGAAKGRITAMYAPHSAASCSKEFLAKIREQASNDNTMIHTHVLETEDELHLMKKRYGMCSVNLLDSIGFLGPDVLAAHCVWLSDGDIDILKNRKVNVVHCPSSNMALGAGITPVPKMLEKGINVALGTDGCASGGSLDMWKDMRMASLVHKLKDPRSMPVEKVMEMATMNGAKALNIKTGMLKPGFFADIIIVDLKKPHFISSNLVSSLVHCTGGCDVKSTIVNGKILMEDHKVKLDEEKIIDDARKTILNITENNN